MAKSPQSHLKLSRYNYYLKAPKNHVLVYNSLSTASVVMTRGEWNRVKAIHRGMIPRKIQPYIETLLRFQILVDAELDELARFDTMHRMARFGDGVLTLTIAPTMACNFMCDYCYQSHDRDSRRMDKKTRDALLAWIEPQLANLKYLSVAWYGGEPTLAWEVIRDLTNRIRERCDEHGVKTSFSMVTNGYALTASKCKELDALGIRSLQITLDGPGPVHDTRRFTRGGRPSYEKILKNIAGVIQHSSARINIRVNVDQRNQNVIDALVTDLSERDLTLDNRCGLYFAPVDDCSPETKGVQHLIMQKKEFYHLENELHRMSRSKRLSGERYPGRSSHGGCAAVSKNGWVVLPDGDIHRCWNDVSNPECRVGSLFSHDRRSRDEVNNIQWLSWEYEEMCRNCKALPLCVGGCPYKDIRPDIFGKPGKLKCRRYLYNIRDNLRDYAELRQYAMNTVPVGASEPVGDTESG
ncbi:MAG: radical SAM protein [Candidatus Krumholzibacteria bacterium]|nr:radical SAM protein [Candidatus Krumholzibacteria bacterium]